MLLGIIATLLPLLFFKYAHFLDFLWFEVDNLFIPLGISYYTFQTIHYLVEVRKNPQIQLSYEHLLFYLSFFPTMTAGPISRVSDFQHQGEIYTGMGEQMQAPDGREMLYPALAYP